MRRFCVLVAIVLASLLSVRSSHAQPQRNGGNGGFRVVPDAFTPAQILGQLTALTRQRAYPHSRDDPPDALDRYISTVWRALGVPDRWDGHCPLCESHLVDTQGRFVVLRIQMADWQYRFAVFLAPLLAPGAADQRWRLERYADTDVKYDIPSYRRESVSGRSFFVVEHDTGGTGMYERGDAWYELAPQADGVALDLPTSGHDELFAVRAGGADFHLLAHEWQAQVSHRPDARDNTLRVALTARYKLWNGDDPDAKELFTRQQSAAFVWDDTVGRFKLDPSQSDVSEPELKDVYRAEGMNAETFARYNAADVNRILDRGSDEQKRALAALGVIRP